MKLRIAGMNLRTKIILLVSMIVLAVSLSYVIVFTREIKNALQRELIKRGSSLVDNIAFNSRYGVIAEDTIILTQLTDGFFQDPEVSFVAIYNKDKKRLLWRFKEKEIANEEEIIRRFISDTSGWAEYTSLAGSHYVVFNKAVLTEKGQEIEEGSVIHGYVLLGLNSLQMRKVFRKIQLSAGTFFLIFLAGAWIISTILVGRVTSSLRDMTKMAQHIASGDLKHTVETEEGGEIGALADSFNKMVFYLNEAIVNIGIMLDEISSATKEMLDFTENVSRGARVQSEYIQKISTSIEEINSSIKEIAENVDILFASSEESSSSILEMSASVEEVAENADVLMQAVEETTASLDEMVASIKQVAGNVETLMHAAESIASAIAQFDATIKQVEANASDTAQISEGARKASEEGVSSVEASIEGMRRIKSSMEDAARELRGLVEKIREIGNIVNVIDEIAEQTNLLALNAAIIAAQAGEHGRGFAVVADAIKKLADRTSISTGEIKGIIENIQESANVTVKAMDMGMKTIEEGMNLSLAAGKVLKGIAETSILSANKSKEIAIAMREQAEGSRQLRASIEKIKSMVDEIAKATYEQSKGGDRIAMAAQKMKEVAEHVKNSTKEQEKGSKHIAKAIENITEMIKYIHKATEEQAKNTSLVLDSINKVAEISSENAMNTEKVSQLVTGLKSRLEKLYDMVKKFKTKKEVKT
jgi:methyl-accepting chemotaxis protein